MIRIIKTVLLVLVLFVGGWLLYNRQQIQSTTDALTLAKSQLIGESENSFNPFELVKTSDYTPRKNFRAERYPAYRSIANNQNDSQGSVIRVASFKLDSTASTNRVKRAADICQQYDVMAIQNNSSLSIARLVNELNNRGFDFRFVDQRGTNQKFATIFNQQSIVLEDQHWYTVNDPEDLFQFEPLVAWFRAANVPVNEAFTFTLANVQLNASEPDKELAHLGELFRAIRLDGRGEDDVILAGDFLANDLQLRKLHHENGLRPVIFATATNTKNDLQLDNFLYDEHATVEFSGESGVFDFMKRFNLTLVDAMAISNRMPIWAEFAVYEGRTPGRAATNY